ncbi:filamentous hemagglutinin family protein [Rhodoblastus sphagnicola]|uniref:two-partner secretion domain-containing protein n=1 Tax=Rhodoblastus sphagnicola TaxID=333368 RepID=UPI000CECB930|nr:filamentous hemagglutinin N-terminal domain-containing protein [Rhodoblastus sphagnicola]MBB4200031.1 filamentous hemagglutinin family protein [Rhodoblastus sphagnicola]
MALEKPGVGSSKARPAAHGKLSDRPAKVTPLAGRSLSRRLLLTGVSALALVITAPDPGHARPLNGGGGAVSAPNIAADAAAQAAQQAAGAARQSADSLSRAARTVQDMQALQAAARQTSLTAPATIPNGLSAGGLLPNMPAGWTGVNAPAQSVDGSGQTQVGIRQTAPQAILNWTSFNVGARTTLTFDQQGNAGWAALNRVNGATAPSQILGAIKADGQVYVINQNGIILGGASQINVGSLIASSAVIDDSKFLATGIYSTGAATPSFTAAGGQVVVERGASIGARAPSSVTAGGGFALMIGSAVENGGTISTPKGQALLVAGDSFILRRGFSTDGNLTSTTRGIELSPIIGLNSESGNVSNTGLILAQQGDITLAGRTLLQNGALIATTSVNTRGTIHLLNSASDSAGSITLAGGGLTAILPELDSAETALDSQRAGLVDASIVANAGRAANATGAFGNLSLVADRQDQSRVEIVTGGAVTFKGGSATAAQGGQIAVSAGRRIFTEDGALLDASGVRNVALAMASNNIKVNIQGNELRDLPQNRESNVLKNNDVWIDVRGLTLAPAGVGGYASDRYYTRGGLLEVGGYLGATAHTIGEWSAIGGSITLAAPEVIAQKGSRIDISGGALDYAAGWIRSTNLIGRDGRKYSIDTAPGDMSFVRFAGGFTRTHSIQGKVDDRLTETWTSPLSRGRNTARWEEGYTVGRDAGRLILSTPTSVFEADIIADTISGERQTGKRANGVSDGYKLTQTTVAQNGTLALGDYNANGRADLYASDVRISSVTDIAKGPAAGIAALPAGRAKTAWFDADHLSAQKLGGVDFGARGAITIDAPLVLADGGNVTLIAPVIDIKADVTARAGAVSATNLFTAAGGGGSLTTLILNGGSTTTLRESATIDVRGVWSNLQLDALHGDGLARRDGGSVSLGSTGSVLLEKGSAIDVSSGAALERDGKLRGGRGGDVTLTANLNSNSSAGLLELGGVILGYGVTGGGSLTVQAGRVQIGSAAEAPAAGAVVLGEGFFNKGFGNYNVTGNQGLTVVAGADIDVSMPVYSLGDRAVEVITGGDPAAALKLWTPPLYLPNVNNDLLVQRGGANLTLNAGNFQGTVADLASVQLSVERGAVISVDPGRAIRLSSIGQLTVDGALNAWGGSIDIGQTRISDAELARGLGHGRSIWIGDHAVLDVAARAATSVNLRGGRYGAVANGGNITIGSSIDLTTGEAASAPDLFVVVRSGARLDASGAQATLDLAGQGAVNVASNGGAITLTSNNGLYLDGAFVANAGGAGAAGGSLSIALEAPTYLATAANTSNRVLASREIILSQAGVASGIAGAPDAAADGLVYGYGRLGADRLTAGGFDNLTLLSHGLISFDNNVSLAMRQSLRLYSAGLVLVETSAANARVDLSAAYVNLSGVAERNVDGRIVPAYRLGGVSAREADARFSVSSHLLDIQKEVRFNISGAIRQLPSGTLMIDRRGFADVTLASTGDLRLLGVTRLETSADLTLAAAQVYPGTGASATVHAG